MPAKDGDLMASGGLSQGQGSGVELRAAHMFGQVLV
jgi:hypothetical protein